MITIHHLAVSQSDRIVWLMEELGLPYQLKWYKRGPDRLAPPEFLALHPAATAPIIEDAETIDYASQETHGLILDPQALGVFERQIDKHAFDRPGHTIESFCNSGVLL